jgi:hypothetical protein
MMDFPEDSGDRLSGSFEGEKSTTLIIAIGGDVVEDSVTQAATDRGFECFHIPDSCSP